ncbi:MAG: hypothetical protein ABIN25_06825, partial [Ginsengibacter sp.]
RINSSLNALYYVTAAIEEQYKKLFNCWATIIKNGVEAGGAVKEAIVNFIGAEKVSLIDGMEDLPLHDIGVRVSIKQREEEKYDLKQNIYNLKAQGVISVSDEYQLSAFQNPKDKFKYLAVKEKQFQKRQDKIRQEQLASQQALMQQQGENVLAAKKEEIAGEKEIIYAKGEIAAKIEQLKSQLGIQQNQFTAIIEKQINMEKQKGQVEKLLTGINAKSAAKSQEALI